MAGAISVGGGKRGSPLNAGWVLNLLTDLAFNLLIFFVVCASAEKDTRGRPQQVPSASKDKATDAKPQNVEVALGRTTIKVNGTEVADADLPGKIAELLKGKAKPDDRIVVVKSEGDTPYDKWIRATTRIEQAGGVVTLQLEEEKVVGVN